MPTAWRFGSPGTFQIEAVKSWRYGTIIVDLERRKVMDILEDTIIANLGP
jgi:transposase